MENGGNFEHLGFEGDDDEDLDDDVFSSGSYSFNGRLVISGEPIIFPVLERSGKLNHKQLACIYLKPVHCCLLISF